MRFFHLCWTTLLLFGCSYIHPDEHFQSLEVLAGRILGLAVDTPWEFSSSKPARSLTVLYIVYGPLLYLVKNTGAILSPLQTWYLVKLQNVILTYLCTYFFVKTQIPLATDKVKAMNFIWTSYVTLVYQSHCFSNTVETWLVILAVVMLSALRHNEKRRPDRRNTFSEEKIMFLLGLLFSVGFFNRITFPCFVILPSYFLVRRIYKDIKNILYFVLGLSVLTLTLILIDSYLFGTLSFKKGHLIDITNLTVTPLNNVLYNSNFDNLASHGYHPYYTHLLVNFPLALGPGILMILYIRRLEEWMVVPFMSILGGVICLSCLPHQELRFIMPVVPFVCSFFSQIRDEPTKGHGSYIFRKSLLRGYYFFNVLLAIMMGIFHQGGILPATQVMSEIYKNDNISFIWWRTYSPPLWLLGKKAVSFQRLDNENFVYNNPTANASEIVDTMGRSKDKINQLLKYLGENNRKVFICLPKASFNLYFNDLKVKKIWEYRYHLDLDHIDWTNHQSLTPGLCIYELL